MNDFNFELKGFVQSVNNTKPDANGNVNVAAENAVQRVNNIAPDSTGNVTIAASDVGAPTSADFTKEVERATKAEQANATAVATAQKTADAAQTTANTAKANAATAQETANNAETSAGNAARAIAAETKRAELAEGANAKDIDALSDVVEELKQQAYTVTGETLVILKPNIATVTGETLVIKTT